MTQNNMGSQTERKTIQFVLKDKKPIGKISNIEANPRQVMLRELRRPILNLNGPKAITESSRLGQSPSHLMLDSFNASSFEPVLNISRAAVKNETQQKPIQIKRAPSQPDVEVGFDVNSVPVQNTEASVRRKSVYGWLFGGLSKLELKTMNLVIPKESKEQNSQPMLQLNLVDNPRSVQKRTIKFGKQRAEHARGSLLSASSKKSSESKGHYRAPSIEEVTSPTCNTFFFRKNYKCKYF